MLEECRAVSKHHFYLFKDLSVFFITLFTHPSGTWCRTART